MVKILRQLSNYIWWRDARETANVNFGKKHENPVFFCLKLFS